MSYFQRKKSDCRSECFYTTGPQKKVDCFKAERFVDNGAQFEAMYCSYHYCPCQEAGPARTETKTIRAE